MKINFYRQRFYLENEAYSKGATTVYISSKKSLRYQILILLNYKTNESKVYDLYGISSVKVSPNYDEAWTIKRNKEIYNESCNYSEKEIQVIKKFICFLADKRLAVCEALCESLGSNILSLYHSSYGSLGLNRFKTILPRLECIKGIPEKKLYDRPRYSIESLARDLYTSRDTMIYTDPELIGEYNRISVKRNTGSKTVLDKWAKLTGISGNRTRANINLTVSSYVTVTIPENEHGVEPGVRELRAIRSFSLVTDGMLNMKEIGIKTGNTKLLGKLKRLGIVEPMLFKDEYVVDLTKLPVATKKPMPGVLQLALAEYMVKRDDIILTYLRKLIYMKKQGISTLPQKLDEPEKDEATLYLESLGIFGNFYYPNKQKTEPKKLYKALEVEGRVVGIPENVYPNIRSFINIGSCKNSVIFKILEESGMRDLITQNLDKIQKELEYYQLEKGARILYLRDLKFRAIIGKTLRFTDKKSMETITKRLEKYGVCVSWKVHEIDVPV